MNKNKLIVMGIGLGMTGVAIPASAYLNNLSLDDINSHKKLDMDFDNNNALNKVTNKLYNPTSTTAKYVSSLKGNAYEPNNSKINVPFKDIGITDKDKTLTVSFILKWEGIDNTFMPISIKGTGTNGVYDLWIRTNTIGFNTGNSEVYGTTNNLVPGKYYSIVAEFNQSDITKNKLYIDGVKQDLSYVTGTSSKVVTWDNSGIFTIGGYSLNENYNTNDKTIIDEVKLYTKSLTQTEVNEVTNSHKIPELQSEVVSNKYPRLDWATEILPENIFWQVGYEENEQSNIDLVYNVNNKKGDGGQYFDNTNVYTGNHSIYTPKTRPDKGNWVLYPYTGTSVSNHIYYRGNPVTFKNDDKISISYRVKTNQKASIRILADWKYEKHFTYYGVKTTADVKKGATVIPVTDASQFDFDMRIALDTDPNVIDESLQERILSADTTNNTITMVAGLPKDIPAGTELYYRKTHWAFEDSTKTINPSDKWQLINFNTGLAQSDYLDWTEHALNLRQGWATYGEVYMDDLKIGYATKVRLYRDGAKVYEGYDATFNDTSAKDKGQPNRVSTSSIKTTMEMVNPSTSQRKLKINFDAVKDTGTSYDYQISSIDKQGVESPKSLTETVTVTSGIKGYTYVIDKNPTTNPPNVVNTTSTEIETDITDSGVYYLHIQSIDNAGNVSAITHHKIDIPTLTAKANPTQDLIRLDWSMDDANNKTFKVYQKKPGSSEFQTVSSTNFDTTKQVKVLNIYPVDYNNVEIASETFTNWKGETYTLPQSARLKRWMEEPNSEHPKGYGQGIIDVTPVSIVDFNSNYNSILKNSDGTWKYDVIMLGSWDGVANTNPTLTNESVSLIEEYIKSGRGFLAGHDTIGYTQGTQSGLGRIRNLFNIKVGRWTSTTAVADTGHDYYGGFKSDKTILKKKGLLTNYPWNLGDVGTQYQIPTAHSTSNFAYGDIWMTFPDGALYSGNKIPENLYPYANYYLTTWNNTAMIQTGHSNGEATPDEQKILANTLFYLNQLSGENYLDDNSGQDVTAPNIPQIYEHKFVSGGAEFKFNEVVDKGSKYSYYVESKSKNDDITLSNVVDETITSGIKGYSYVLDNNANTIPDNTVDINKAGTLKVNMTSNAKYIHIKAIDKAGNVSDTFHYEIIDNKEPNLELSIKNNEISKTVGITINAFDNEFGSGISKVKLPNGNFVTVNAGESHINSVYNVSKNGTYEFVAYDKAGNTTAKSITVSNVDDALPTMTITGNPTAWTGEPVTLKVTANDTFSGMKHIVLPNGSIVNGNTANYTVTANGSYIFKAVDKAGNELTQTVNVTKIDNSSPQFSYRKELSADKLSMNLVISALDSQSGIDYFIDPEGNKIYEESFTYTVTDNGIYPFVVYDKVGKSTSVNIGVTELNTNINPSEIDRIEYKLSGATIKDWTVYDKPFYITNEGITTITARAYDKAGNLSNETTSTVKIDKTKPNNNSILIELK